MPQETEVSRRLPCGVTGSAVYVLLAGILITPGLLKAALLFEDDFNRGIPGWTAVQPPGAYNGGPLRWEYDVVSGGFVEQSNIYTDSSTASATAIAPMLINDTVTAISFVYRVRLNAGDDDGFGLVFGYQNETNFYRVTFARQSRTGFPWTGWGVDRKVNGATVALFGGGTAGYTQTFVNTAGQPFDVIIEVDTASRFSLTVLDNPASGAPTLYRLVATQPLPSPANGKLGLMTWGMAGGVPRGFSAQNLDLTPIALSGGESPLANWTPVVPPRASGSVAVSGGHGQPLWTLSSGPTGPYGALRESSDCLGGNDAAGQVDFTGPTIVAGNESWTDYTVAARITPGDDDGHGLILRYKNLTNFYRIALRSQSSTLGVRRGLSVQKCVNRSYAEVFSESTPKYYPASNVPYDLVASAKGSTLNILLVADPEGEARFFNYGPMAITGVPNGKIGLFSWGMSRTDFDWVTAHDDMPLYVSSPHGSPEPAKGLSSFAPGTIVSALAGVEENQPGTRRRAVGWVGAGSVPASGSGSNVVFAISEFSRLHWLWQTEFELKVTSGPGGTVSLPPAQWLIEGTNIMLTAQPAQGFAFAGWTGSAVSSASTLQLLMDQPHTLHAAFTADSDGDKLPDDWELAYFGSILSRPGDDPDADGRNNSEEHNQSTDPTVPDIFRITSLSLTNTTATLVVSNNTGTRYAVEHATNLAGPWVTIMATQYAPVISVGVNVGNPGFLRLQQPARPAETLPFVPGSWSMVVLPDTQNYASSYPELLKDQIRWILANRERRNIKYVLQLGDLTNNNTSNQWDNVKAAFSMLDGSVPYALATGNHDYGASRSTLLNSYFSAAQFAAWPTFGGLFEAGKMENTCHLFSAGGRDWLILSLEWGPRNSVVAWANSMINAHPTRRAILITHAYLYSDDTRYDWPAKGTAQSWSPYYYSSASDPDGTNDGEDLWRKLVKVNQNFAMTLNGHVLNDGLGRLASTNDYGRVVHQMLVNYQMKPLGGEATLRLMEFLSDGTNVHVTAYSPLYGTYKTDPDNSFTFVLEP